ncbi:hypothetical protein REG_0861 [Candidatus Regiella insecticola LSR1]|uniref:Uncharacterized protein n=1 Tax=Candidatus Regiella insecticola LSR1 TaxID=663321 RepID=E0WSC3_9ENTR|nr:hypothetical protein REG_0861 [Candidatus Regiella insecticola LSR1]
MFFITGINLPSGNLFAMIAASALSLAKDKQTL